MNKLDNLQETTRIAGRFFSHLKHCLKTAPVRVDLPAALAQLHLSERDADGALGFHQYYQLLQILAPQLQETGFFLELGDRYHITDIGVLGYAGLSAKNLRKAWDISFYGNQLLPHPLTGYRREQGQRVCVELPAPAHLPIDSRYLQEEWLAATWKWLRQRLPQFADSQELHIRLGYAAPSYKATYRKIFPGKVMFEQQVTELSIPLSWYEEPFSAANPATAKLCNEQCLLIMAKLGNKTDLAKQVQRFLLLTPQREFPSLEQAAKKFRLPPHTFHRRLKFSGASYRQLVNAVRMQLAKEYVENTALMLNEIGYLLGYDYPPNFNRAFKKWFGVAPDCYRKDVRQNLCRSSIANSRLGSQKAIISSDQAAHA